MNSQELKSKALGGKFDKIKSSSFIYRFQRNCSFSISSFLTKFFSNIKPNHISFLAIILVLLTAIFGLAFRFINPYFVVLVQLGLLFGSSILDKVDGELARIQNHFSQKGVYFDILYHLYYVLVLYLSVGIFFFVILEHEIFFFSSVLLGFLMMTYRISGKIRHHVRFKINLENHKDSIVDLGRKKRVFSQTKPVRWLNYLVFMVYDWVWLWYVMLILISYYDRYLIGLIYLIYTLVAIALVFGELFWRYPKESLFTREEL